MINVAFKFSHERTVYFINESGIIGYSPGIKTTLVLYFRRCIKINNMD